MPAVACAAESDHMGPQPRSSLSSAGIGEGESVGDYVIEALLGHGTEGDVYLARDLLLGRRVALKTLRSTATEATHGMEEARLMASVEHPNVVRVYHAQRHQGVWLVVFEYIAGGSLQAYVERAGPLPAARAVELAAGAAAGLGHVHELGILHRDVKPHNLLLGQQGELKLGDFGLALDVRGVSGGRSPAVGTPAFMAPELWGEGTPSVASDIYSLGACLYFMLTGRVPFPFSSLEQLEHAHRKLQPQLPVDVPAGVRQATLAMLAKAPASRPTSASQLAHELTALARDPHAPLQASLSVPARSAASPLISGGKAQALTSALSLGPDGVYVERLVELLQEPARAIVLQAEHPTEASSVLASALLRCAPRRRVGLRMSLPEASASVQELLLRQVDLEPGAPLTAACQRLVERAGTRGGRCLLELQCSALPDERQRLDLERLACAGAPYELTIVLLVSAAGTEASCLPPGFEPLRLPSATQSARDFAERIRLWLSAATAGRWQASADAVRLLRHLCREQGLSWPQLTHDSLLMSAAARLPVLTSWAVQAAQACAVPLHSVADVPVEWRSAPRRWPTPQLAVLLGALRQQEQTSEQPTQLPALDPG